MNRGGRPRKTGAAATPVSEPTLRDLKISKAQSSQWQKLAKIPREEFDAILAEFEDQNRKPSTAAILRAWNGLAARRRPASFGRMAAALRRAGWIVIPPRGGTP